MIAAERLKMEKMFIEFNRNNNDPDTDRQSPPGQTGHNDVSLSERIFHFNFVFVENYLLNPCIRENIILKSFTGVLELRTKSTGNVRGMQTSSILRHLLPTEGLGAAS